MIFRKTSLSTVDEGNGPLWHGMTTSSTNETGEVMASAFGAIFAVHHFAVQGELQLERCDVDSMLGNGKPQ